MNHQQNKGNRGFSRPKKIAAAKRTSTARVNREPKRSADPSDRDVLADISERKAAEQRAAEQARLLDLSNDAIIVRKFDGTIVYWNRGAERLYGWTREEAIGQSTHELLHTVYPVPLALIEQRLMDTALWTGELKHRRRDGQELTVLCRKVLDVDKEGTPAYVLETNTDITDRKRAAEALRESEARYRSFVEATAHVVWRMNQAAEVDEPMPSWNAFTGQTDEQASGFGWMQAIHPDDRARVTQAWGKAISERQTYEAEYRLRSQTGEYRDVVARGVPVFAPDGQIKEYIGTCMDVTDRRKAESEAQEKETLLRTVTNEARVGLVVLDRERRYRFVNQAYADILDLPSTELLGKKVADVLPQLWEQIRPMLNRAYGGERVKYDLHGLGRGEVKRIYEVVYEPHLSDGPDEYVVVVLVDVTERNQAQQNLERVVAERTKRLQETVQELESFSYSIAHDMRAPLRAMQSFASIFVEDYGTDVPEQGKLYLQRIRTAANRLDELIRDVLDYSKVLRGDVPLSPLDPEELVREVVDSYPHLRAPGVSITVEGPMPKVMANRAAMTQVISNLLTNAVKFVRADEPARVRVWADNGPARKGMARLWFEDNGIGIDKGSQERIFNMFQRLNRPGLYEGTGIGLAIVKKAAERMGGRVGVESEREKGSRFWVELRKAER